MACKKPQPTYSSNQIVAAPILRCAGSGFQGHRFGDSLDCGARRRVRHLLRRCLGACLPTYVPR